MLSPIFPPRINGERYAEGIGMHGEKEVFSWDAGGRGSDRIVGSDHEEKCAHGLAVIFIASGSGGTGWISGKPENGFRLL